jgi:hypothetical protein
MVSYGKILTTYAEPTDKYLMAFGYFSAIATGIAMPSFVFIMGDILNSFGDNALEAIKRQCLIMVYIGLAVWVTSYFYYASLVAMAERVGRKTKINYLKAILS